MFRFLETLFPQRPDEQILREISPATFLQAYYPQSVPATRPATVALLPFNEPTVRAAIHETKYHGTRTARHLLSHALATYLRSHEALDRVRLVPVPLGKRRKKNRGFNQVELVCIDACSLLADEAPSLNTRLLVRTRETASQVSLSRSAREENMRGAFTATQSPDPDTLYIVVDDVLTTGATLQAAIDALSAAGATHVLSLAFAH